MDDVRLVGIGRDEKLIVINYRNASNDWRSYSYGRRLVRLDSAWRTRELEREGGDLYIALDLYIDGYNSGDGLKCGWRLQC